MKKITYLTTFLLLIFTEIAMGQVAQKVVVEHFTNTRCGICANRNPGFFGNLNNQDNVLHLSVHPSSPYSSCLLNQHNVSENDGRTHYYSVYGGTPRLVIQGQVISAGTNYSNPSIFANVVNQTTPFSLRMEQAKNDDLIKVNIIIKAESEHNLTTAKLFVALVEDTVFYNAPNGEDMHFDVFRKALTEVTGDALTVPTAIGDSTVISFEAPAHEDWDFARIFALAILQDEATRAVIQTNATHPNEETIPTETPTGFANGQGTLAINIYPNPAHNSLTVNAENVTEGIVSIFDLTGKLMIQQQFNQVAKVNVTQLPTGQYFLHVEGEQGKLVTKFVKNQ